MNKELQCNIVNDLLPLYMDDLTSEETNSFIKKHLEECQNCQNEYRTFKAELSNSANRNNATKMQEIDYLKKINIYQKMNLFWVQSSASCLGMFTCIESWHTCTSKRSSP